MSNINNLTSTELKELIKQASVLCRKKQKEEKEVRLKNEYNIFKVMVDNNFTFNNIDIKYIPNKEWKDIVYNANFNNKYITNSYKQCKDYRDKEIIILKKEQLENKWKITLESRNIPYICYRITDKELDNIFCHRNKLDRLLEFLDNYSSSSNESYPLKTFISDAFYYAMNNDVGYIDNIFTLLKIIGYKLKISCKDCININKCFKNKLCSNFSPIKSDIIKYISSMQEMFLINFLNERFIQKDKCLCLKTNRIILYNKENKQFNIDNFRKIIF